MLSRCHKILGWEEERTRGGLALSPQGDGGLGEARARRGAPALDISVVVSAAQKVHGEQPRSGPEPVKEQVQPGFTPLGHDCAAHNLQARGDQALPHETERSCYGTRHIAHCPQEGVPQDGRSALALHEAQHAQARRQCTFALREEVRARKAIGVFASDGKCDMAATCVDKQGPAYSFLGPCAPTALLSIEGCARRTARHR